MPAIQPARLRKQAALLAQSFDQPEVFIRSLPPMTKTQDLEVVKRFFTHVAARL